MRQSALIDAESSAKLSLEDWYALPEDEPGELVDGWLVEEEMPDYVHELLVVLLARILGNWVFPLGGVMGGSDAKLAIGPRSGRKPDLTVYLPGSPFPPRRGVIRQPPDIAVEVVSPQARDGRRDRVEKVNEYAAFGIRYYWLVDPELRSFEILELGKTGHYTHVLGATGGKLGAIPGCEGLELDLDSLWVDVDRLPSADTEA